MWKRTVSHGLALSSLLALGAGCGSGISDGGESIATTNEALTTGAVLVNQLGYRTDMNKVAVVYGAGCNGRTWTLLQSGTTKATGTTSAAVTDPSSGDTVCKADFSSYTTAGTGFTVSVSGMGTSQSFVISATDQYASLYENAISYFTYHRLGSQVVNISLPGAAGGTVTRNWALRPVDAAGLSAYANWTSGLFMVDGGHADAGDFGKYPDNAAHAMWVLMNLYELKAPNTALRDEAAYGVKFFTGILPGDTTKQATHKCHDDSWGTQNWGGYPNGADVSNTQRHCMGPSITATYAMVRALAQASRMLAASDATTANNYWTLAQNAWNRANKALTPTYNGPSPGAAVGGGDYQDTDATDDLYDAAVEMYLTAKSRSVAYTAYLPTVTGSTWYKRFSRRNFDWQYDANDGNLSLLTYNIVHPGSLGTEIDTAGLQTALLAEADAALSSISGNGYPTPMAGNDCPWGSNKIPANTAILLGVAHTLSGQAKYLQGIHQSMDYLMGVNTLGFGFITGYGTTYVKATHDRQANGNSPIGWLSGGPINASEVNDSLTPKNTYCAKNYYTTDAGWDNAWCSKENAIDWNAPLAWMAWYMRNPAASSGGDTQAPTVPTGLTAGSITSSSVNLTWTASTDNVGVTGYKIFNGATQAGTSTTTSFNVTGLTASTAYTFSVKAYDAAGNNSASSTSVNATTSAGSDTTAPTAPTNLTTSGITTTTITLNWTASTDNVGVTGYKVYKNNVLVTSIAPGTSYQFTGLTAGTSYTLGVAAFDAAGNNSATTSGTASTTSASDTQAPTAPSNLTTSGITSSTITLNWAASTDNVGVTGYRVYKGGVLQTTVSGTTLSYQFTGLTASTNYTLGVAAIDAAGNASATTSGSATTSAASCTPETDTAFCTRLAKNCGSVTANDNCGTSRTVSSCGTCTSPATCGGGGTANVCGSAGSGPCAGLCTVNRTYTISNIQSGNLGTGAICAEVTSVTLSGGNCSNMSSRVVTVNGTTESCANWTIPAKVNGGYCVQVTAGTPDYASFSTW